MHIDPIDYINYARLKRGQKFIVKDEMNNEDEFYNSYDQEDFEEEIIKENISLFTLADRIEDLSCIVNVCRESCEQSAKISRDLCYVLYKNVYLELKEIEKQLRILNGKFINKNH